MSGSLILIQTTLSSRRQAEAMASRLVEQSEVACAQIIGPITSVYRWQNRLEQREEYMLIAKTMEDNYQTVADNIRRHHPYEVPEILALTASAADASYLKWVADASE